MIHGGGHIVFPTVHEPPRNDTAFGPEVCVPIDPLLAAIMDKRQQGTSNPQIGSLPNRFKAAVPVDFEPARAEVAVLGAWRRAAEAVWKNFVEPVAGERSGSRAIWDRQIDNFWEIAWVIGDRVDDGSDNAWLDARKNWRAPASTEPEAGDHCTAMHAWQEPSGWTRASNRRDQDEFWKVMSGRVGELDLRHDERLCAIALVKRLFPRVAKQAIGWEMNILNWPSTAYMAAAPWLAALLAKAPDAALEYSRCVQTAFKDGACGERATRIASFDGLDPRLRAVTGLDGNAFHVTALANERVTPLRPDADRSGLREKLEECNRRVDFQASNFYALLLMDGDSLGALLRKHDAGIISRALADFTGKVPGVVGANNGVTVYAGGDDVLALLPLPDALPAAMALDVGYRGSFRSSSMPDATISGAIVYAQYKQPLAEVVKTAHHLLDDVAKDRNGRASLAVAVMQSSGTNVEWVASFESGAIANLAKLSEECANGDGPFSTSFIYGLRDLFGLWSADYVRGGIVPEMPLDETQLCQLLRAQLMNDRERAADRDEAEAHIARLLPAIRFHRCDGNGKCLPAFGLQPSGARLASFLSHPGEKA